MTILKSEEEFLDKLKKLKEEEHISSELSEFLDQVYASKLYYQYYNKFISDNYKTVIEQFRKLSKNSKAKPVQLRAALEIACSDIHELCLQLEDCRQDLDHKEEFKEEAFVEHLAINIFPIKVLLCLNIIATIIIVIGLFK